MAAGSVQGGGDVDSATSRIRHACALLGYTLDRFVGTTRRKRQRIKFERVVRDGSAEIIGKSNFREMPAATESPEVFLFGVLGGCACN